MLASVSQISYHCRCPGSASCSTFCLSLLSFLAFTPGSSPSLSTVDIELLAALISSTSLHFYPHVKAPIIPPWSLPTWPFISSPVSISHPAFGFAFSSLGTRYLTWEKSLSFFGSRFPHLKRDVEVVPFEVLLLESIKIPLKRLNGIHGYSPNYKGNERCLGDPYKIVLIKWHSGC